MGDPLYHVTPTILHKAVMVNKNGIGGGKLWLGCRKGEGKEYVEEEINLGV